MKIEDLVQLDPLSMKARRVLQIEPASAYNALVPNQTGPAEASDLLESIQPDELFSDPPVDAVAARCVMCALWLWHDFLDQSHTISQSIENAEGNYWHAIMHRREGDFSNSKYWYRRVGTHASVKALEVRANELLRDAPADKNLFRLTSSGWDAFAFVDLVEAADLSPEHPHRELVVRLQVAEWQTLFDWCVRKAIGR